MYALLPPVPYVWSLWPHCTGMIMQCVIIFKKCVDKKNNTHHACGILTTRHHWLCVVYIYILIECVSILKYLILPDLLSALILLYFVLLIYVTYNNLGFRTSHSAPREAQQTCGTGRWCSVWLPWVLCKVWFIYSPGPSPWYSWNIADVALTYILLTTILH
jgi:hypothetical protein